MSANPDEREEKTFPPDADRDRIRAEGRSFDDLARDEGLSEAAKLRREFETYKAGVEVERRLEQSRRDEMERQALEDEARHLRSRLAVIDRRLAALNERRPRRVVKKE